ncbi:MAG TPA: endonuclease [Elusimicrobia bacterium]|nr:endonuclease [Elusimicrobiota bacterium]
MLYKIYKKLLKYFGPQGWWPIGGIYKPAKKYFSEKEKFEIMVGAILTQNTAWNNVEKALSNLRSANLLNIKKISKINLRKLQSLIKPSGFYKQKAKRLKNFTNSIRPIGLIENLRREYLLSLNGVGPETADSILLYGLGKPYFVIDAYTKRLINRLGIFDSQDYHEIQKFFEKNVPKDVEIYKEYHALIVALAKNFCKKNPECKNCPIINCCKQNNVAPDL